MHVPKLVASSALVIASIPSAAAYCDSFPTVEQEFKASALVFVGKVTSAREVAVRNNAITGGAFYSVELVELLKGRPHHKLQLYSENSTARFPMEVGLRYLIFAARGAFQRIRGE
jgi:hypothetical protein